MRAEAIAHPNIALIKYWGNRDDSMRIPSNGSISLTLGGLENRMKVHFDPALDSDQLTINGELAGSGMLDRASQHLELLRRRTDVTAAARIESTTNFPLGAGIASSAAAYAALTLASAAALTLNLDRKELSRIARRGSGSAARSIYGGFVELVTGETDEDCYAEQIMRKEHWELVDLVVVVDDQVKHTGSTVGHTLASTSPLQEARIADSPRRLEACRNALRERDFDHLAQIVELDSDMMHAIMMTSSPPLYFWGTETLNVMQTVRDLRSQGIAVCYTLDAGPNVHCICLPSSEEAVLEAFKSEGDGDWKLLRGHAGPGARVV